MGSNSLNFTFNPFAFEDLYQIAQVSPVAAMSNPVNPSQQDSGSMIGSQADPTGSEPVGSSEMASLLTDGGIDEAASYRGTRVNLYA